MKNTFFIKTAFYQTKIKQIFFENLRELPQVFFPGNSEILKMFLNNKITRLPHTECKRDTRLMNAITNPQAKPLQYY